MRRRKNMYIVDKKWPDSTGKDRYLQRVIRQPKEERKKKVFTGSRVK